MTTKGSKPNDRLRNKPTEPAALPDDFPAELRGEFTQFDKVTEGNIATVAVAALNGGGYFGLSVTDDGGSAKLAIRNARVSFEKRVYRMADFGALLAYSIRKLRD